jgi:hypothetical protein
MKTVIVGATVLVFAGITGLGYAGGRKPERTKRVSAGT